MPYHLLEIVLIMMRLHVPLEFHSVKFLDNKPNKTQVDKTLFNQWVVEVLEAEIMMEEIVPPNPECVLESKVWKKGPIQMMERLKLWTLLMVNNFF